MLRRIKVAIKCLLHIYIVPSDDWHQVKRQWQTTFGESTTKSVRNKENKEVFYNLLYCSHRVLKVKTKSKIVIYLVMRHRLSRFGEVTTKWYPSEILKKKIIKGSHGVLQVKTNNMLHIYIFPLCVWYPRHQSGTLQRYSRKKAKYFTTFN